MPLISARKLWNSWHSCWKFRFFRKLQTNVSVHQSYARHLLFGELFTTIQDDLFFVKTLPGIFQMTGFRLAYLYKVIHTNESLVLLHNLFTHLFCFFKGTAVLTYQSNMTKYYTDSPVFYRRNRHLRQSDPNYMICQSCFSPYHYPIITN